MSRASWHQRVINDKWKALGRKRHKTREESIKRSRFLFMENQPVEQFVEESIENTSIEFDNY